MTDHKISPAVPSTVRTQESARRDGAGRASIRARLTARLRAGRLDRMLAVGVPAPAGSALAVHAARLTAVAEREAVARALRLAVRDAHNASADLSLRVPLNRANIASAEDLIADVTLRLHSPRPVSARGMARLRQLMSDGTGPFYRYGRGDLAGRFGAALAAL
jgi:hypothetical protein